MNTTHQLTDFEQRGKLTYLTHDYSWKSVEGWFYLNKQGVIMRKVGGRNRYFFASIESVLDFVASEATR